MGKAPRGGAERWSKDGIGTEPAIIAEKARKNKGLPSPAYNLSMDERKKKSGREFVERWRRVGPLLEAERYERLRAMTDDDVRAAIADVLSLPYTDQPERGSGLVEQQRILRRAR